MVFISIFLLFLFQSSSIYTGKSQDITSTINKDHYVPADVKRPFEIVNGNRFGVLCQSLLDIAYDSSLVEPKQVILFLIQQQYHDVPVEGMRNQSIAEFI